MSSITPINVSRTARGVIVAALLLQPLLSGCSQKATEGVVSGAVTLDGQPLKTGEIRFKPVDGQSSTAGATITDGKFSAKLLPGEKKIEISAPKITGKQKMYNTPDSPTVDVVEELLPPRYNVQSELTLNVQAGDQEKSFDLTSK